MIQITAQMRVLVAIEAVDGRKYAPSIDMRSRAVRTRRIGPLRGPGRRITSLLSGPKHGEQLIRGSEVTSSQGRRNGFDFLFDGYQHLPLVCEFDGVADEIDEHLPEASGIAQQSQGNVAADVAGQLKVFRPFWWARRLRLRVVSSTSPSRSKPMCSNSILLASILEKSRISLMTLSSDSAPLTIP
jgi:hypothetical protein